MEHSTNAPPSNASASAPGKLILFGEHAVVYGQPAIAACLSDLRIKVDVCTYNKNENENNITIHLPDLKPDPVSIEIPQSSLRVDSGSMKKIVESMKKANATITKDFKATLEDIGPPTSNDVDAIHQVLDNITNTFNSSIQLSELQKSAVVPIIYLVNILIFSDPSFKHGLSITANSQNLPLGAGLGSSAAFSVAASAALYKLVLNMNEKDQSSKHNDNEEQHPSKKLKTDEDCSSSNQPNQLPSKDHLDVINTLAFYSETLIHGTPSGIDNTVSTYGGALQYTKTKYSSGTSSDGNDDDKKKGSETIFLDNFPPLNVILTNTKVPRSTKLLVRGVKELKEEHPDVINPMLDSIGNISRTFRKSILNSSHDSLSQKQMKQISQLIQMNQSLLCALGVSHPSLNAITNLTCSLYDELKCTTKLTGAGGGGCAFTFLEGDDNVKRRCEIVKRKIDSLSNVESHEIANGDENNKSQTKCHTWTFESFTSAVGGIGVMWL